MKKFFDFSLGRDFWNFRMGQLVSLLGDSCSTIALAWWILQKTGSAAAMSAVLAPATVVRVFLLPLLGPFGDKYSRKKIVVIADLWRFVFTGLIAAMVFFDHFNLPLLIVAYCCVCVGSALFGSAASGIIPQIVEREHLQLAFQQTHAINSFAGVIGGIIGGVIVSTLGVFGAFLVDTFSYLIAAICSSLIRAETKPQSKPSHIHPLLEWKNSLTEGFRFLFRIPVLFWFSVVAMFINLSMAPLAVVLPVFAKEGRSMPAWFLGGLESSIGLGAIAGAISLTTVRGLLPPRLFFVLSIAMIGAGVSLLPCVPNILVPLTVLFWIGIGSSWTNIVVGTQVSLVIPDHYRGRFGAILGFMCNGISPIGIAGAGYLITYFGINNALVLMGFGLIILTPLLFLVPLLKDFLSVKPENSSDFLIRHYPDVFG